MTDDATSIPARSTGVEESFENAPADRDDQPSIETVIASLQSRSIGEKQALLKALLDGENAAPLAPHGASSIRNTVEKQQLLPLRVADCSPTVSPNAVLNDGATHSKTTIIGRSRRGPTVSPNRTRGLWQRGSIYQLRIRVPSDLVGLLGQERINRSLGTASRREAILALTRRKANPSTEGHYKPEQFAEA